MSSLRGCLHAQVLRFEACWDDSAQEFGDMRRFRVLYFLADGTMEVRHRVPIEGLNRVAAGSQRSGVPDVLPTARRHVLTAGTYHCVAHLLACSNVQARHRDARGVAERGCCKQPKQ